MLADLQRQGNDCCFTTSIPGKLQKNNLVKAITLTVAVLLIKICNYIFKVLLSVVLDKTSTKCQLRETVFAGAQVVVMCEYEIIYMHLGLHQKLQQ